jgi:hypothetical protein
MEMVDIGSIGKHENVIVHWEEGWDQMSLGRISSQSTAWANHTQEISTQTAPRNKSMKIEKIIVQGIKYAAGCMDSLAQIGSTQRSDTDNCFAKREEGS